MFPRREISVHIFFFSSFKQKNGSGSSEARTLASPLYYLSGSITQALIEHVDLAFSLSPNNNQYDIKSQLASLHMSRIPSSQWLRHVYLCILSPCRRESIYLFLISQKHAVNQCTCVYNSCPHSMWILARLCTERTWRKGWLWSRWRSFGFIFFPLFL